MSIRSGLQASASGISKNPHEISARIAELEARRCALEAETASLNAHFDKLNDMYLEWKRGGFPEVIRNKDEVIRVLRTRVEREVADKESWRRSAEFYRRRAEAPE